MGSELVFPKKLKVNGPTPPVAAPVMVSFALPSAQLIGVVLLATTERVPAARALAGVGVATISGDIHSQPAGCSTLITKVSDGADTE